jgi:YD repeat-containing protein
MAEMPKCSAVVLAVALLAFPAIAGERTEARQYDPAGRYVGRSVTQGNETRFYDRAGRYQGRAVTRGSETRFYDRNGRLEGKARQR